MNQRTIAIIGYDGNTALDLVGAADTFNSASYLHADRPYRIVTASIDGRSIRSGSGLQVMPDCALDAIGAIDTLIIPGGAGLREPAVAEPIIDWIKANEPRIRRVASVCTGLFGLAATGLLDGRRATTHWRFAEQMKALHPEIALDPDAIFVRDGKFATSAGVTAGIDLALALIEEDLGPAAALATARELVVYAKRSGGQQQYSEALRFQTATVPKMAELVHFVQSHLTEDLGVERLAGEANLSVRHFTRLFRQSLGTPPAEFVEHMRLGEAMRRLTATDAPVEGVAFSTGFRSADAFARAFRRQFGVTPSDYRDRFSSATTGPT